MNCLILYFFGFLVLAFAVANPKKYIPEDGGFQPFNYQSESNNETRSRADDKDINESSILNRYQRFGNKPLSGFGNTGGGVQGYPYGGTGPGGVGYPVKIDVGGVALGALLGLGAVLLIPKLATLFHMMGTGYRSADDPMSSITDILARVDNSLEKHNVDSSSCMQRVICSYVSEAKKNSKNGEATTVDQLISTVSNNSLFTYMLDGSAAKQAIDMGNREDGDCSSLESKCPISREKLVSIVASLLPS